MTEMAKLQVILDGNVIQEFHLNRGRITIGRRKHSHIHLDNPAVSGDHAVIERIGRDVYLEDRDSTNGTRLNGKRVIKRQKLHFGDEIAVARYRLRYCDDDAPAQPGFERTLMMTEVRPGGGLVDTRPLLAEKIAAEAGQPAVPVTGLLRVLSGPNAGRELWLKKPVTTLGKTGQEVAIITQTPEGYALRHAEGVRSPRVNGLEIGNRVHILMAGDLVEFIGVHMAFALESAGTTSGS